MKKPLSEFFRITILGQAPLFWRYYCTGGLFVRMFHGLKLRFLLPPLKSAKDMDMKRI